MADIHILRAHALGLSAARKVAHVWVEQARSDFLMDCTYTEGEVEDTASFKRSGVSGTLQVGHDRFVLEARLGFLLGAFKNQIEAEISKNLDALLAPPSSAPATLPAKSAAAPKVAGRKKISPKSQ